MTALDFMFIHKSTGVTMTDPNWRQMMVGEMTTLHSNKTWNILTLPIDKTPMGCLSYPKFYPEF